MVRFPKREIQHENHESRQISGCASTAQGLSRGARPSLLPMDPLTERWRELGLSRRGLLRCRLTLPRVPLLGAAVRRKASNLSHSGTRDADDDSLLRSRLASLRLILGVGRSGTTWVSRVLGSTLQPIRYCCEPLFYLHPRLSVTVAGASR
jgi:hypothetical protein